VISAEPIIAVGIIERTQEIHGVFHGSYELPNFVRLQGQFTVHGESSTLVLKDNEGVEVIRGVEFRCLALNGATCTLCNVTIGMNFHWERKEDQTFEGNLRFLANDHGTISAINEIGVEQYLQSVISSEMSAEAPGEFLKAHAVTSRSWLVAMLERQKKFKNVRMSSQQFQGTKDEILRWYDREDHAHFDVCADDHCQRYQGITKVIAKSAEEAVLATRGKCLMYNNEICDARFSKACGGRTELFEHTWEDTPMPYLQSVSDSTQAYPQLLNEADAERWIVSSPDAYCNTSDGKILKQVLPSFDQETTDFFRWKVEYTQEQLVHILYTKSEIDFGMLLDLVPLSRGPSGRIYKLKVVGSKRTIIVGKELEIRRWFSKSHLYSSAFIVKTERDVKGIPAKFTLFGAGWGHGVGLCQIGAAVMAAKGCNAEEIVKHYFRKSDLRKMY
jgi:stage II sporulation protein D